MDFTDTFPSPLGTLTLASDGAALTGLWLPGQKYFAAGLSPDARPMPDLAVFRQTRAWLTAYFARSPLPEMPEVRPRGTDFQRAVWAALRAIPCGRTTTYGALARELQGRGISAAPRPVGAAVGRNPVSILIPCHRVLGAGGALTGYAGGLAAKGFLLALEGAEPVRE